MLACLRLRKPALNVLPRRTGRIAWREQIDVHRTLDPGRPRAGTPMDQIRQRRDVLPLEGSRRFHHEVNLRLAESIPDGR